jgi:hypothetical protein
MLSLQVVSTPESTQGEQENTEIVRSVFGLQLSMVEIFGQEKELPLML